MKITALAFLSLLGVAACDDDKPAAPAAPAAQAETAKPTAAAHTTPALVAAVPSLKAAAFAAATTQAAPPAQAAQPAGDPPALAVGTKVKCPVSGEDFTIKATTKQVVHAGKRYAFCCADCQPEFEKNPAKFAKN